MKLTKKILLSIVCFSFLLIGCGSSKSVEEKLTSYLNGSLETIALFPYDYDDVSKVGSKENYDKLIEEYHTTLSDKVFAKDINLSDEQKTKLYNALLKSLQSIEYELTIDEIKDTTAQFNVKSNCIDLLSLTKLTAEKFTDYSLNSDNIGKSLDDSQADLLNIFVDCLANVPLKEINTKVLFEKNNAVWKIANQEDLSSIFFN